MKKINLAILSVAAILIQSACQSPAPQSREPASASSSAPEANLTQKEAEDRARTVANVHYELSVQLDEKRETFNGQERVEFDLGQPGKDLFLDFKRRREHRKVLRERKDSACRFYQSPDPAACFRIENEPPQRRGNFLPAALFA